MKRFLGCLASIAVLAALSLLSVEGYAETLTWRLYDNFNKGLIDPDRWNINTSSATITIEGGRAKFVHEVGNPEVSSMLSIKKGLKKIKGIKATVTVESPCTGDVRGRVAGWVGKVGDDYVWNQLALQGGLDRIFGALEPQDADTGEWYDLFWGHFAEPIDLIGNTFTITMIFSKKKVTYSVGGLGKITFKLAEKLSPTDTYLLGIGTRSTAGDGPCTVYFDDVYVLK